MQEGRPRPPPVGGAAIGRTERAGRKRQSALLCRGCADLVRELWNQGVPAVVRVDIPTLDYLEDDMPEFRGWPADATAFLAEIAADNTREFWERHRDRHATAVHAPTRALAAELEPEFGPVRVFRPYVNRRFRPDAPPYRTDTGGVVRTAGGSALAVVLSGTALTVTAGSWTFDGGQLCRYRESVARPAGEELATRLTGLGLDPVATSAQAGALSLDQGRPLIGTPRGFRGDHPRIALLRRRALQLRWTWPLGEWVATREPLERVRSAWRKAAGLVAWLDTHVGPAESTPPSPRPAPVEAFT